MGSWKGADTHVAQVGFSVASPTNGLYTVNWNNGGNSGHQSFYVKKQSDGVYVTSNDTGSPSTFTMVGTKTVSVSYTDTSNNVVTNNFAKVATSTFQTVLAAIVLVALVGAGVAVVAWGVRRNKARAAKASPALASAAKEPADADAAAEAAPETRPAQPTKSSSTTGRKVAGASAGVGALLALVGFVGLFAGIFMFFNGCFGSGRESGWGLLILLVAWIPAAVGLFMVAAGQSQQKHIADREEARKDAELKAAKDRADRERWKKNAQTAAGSGPAQAAAASGPPTSAADELTKLAQLRDQGILTEKEFAAQKAKLLLG